MKESTKDCACIKKEVQAFDFSINTYDCKTIIATDLTNWMDGDGYQIPENYTVTVTLPNQAKVDVSFKGGSTTKISSKDLSGHECLLDGIYCFRTESCGYNYSRSKAVVCTLRCKLDNLISKSDDYEEITKLSNMIDLIEVDAEMGRELNAKKLFKIVDKELDRHSCTCTCR